MRENGVSLVSGVPNEVVVHLGGVGRATPMAAGELKTSPKVLIKTAIHARQKLGLKSGDILAGLH